MDLIDKQDCLLPIHSLIVFCLPDNLLHIFLARNCRIDLSEIGTSRIGNHLCQCCLPGSRRSIKNNRTQLVRLDCPIKQLIFSNYMLLSYHFLQSLRTQTRCKRRLFFLCRFSHIIKQIHIFSSYEIPARSRITSPAMISPATGGTKEILPGSERLFPFSSSVIFFETSTGFSFE